VSLFQAAMRDIDMSTTATSMDGHLSAMTAIVGPPTYPAPMQQIFTILLFYLTYPNQDSNGSVRNKFIKRSHFSNRPNNMYYIGVKKFYTDIQ
jgi:hypothetical protein